MPNENKDTGETKSLFGRKYDFISENNSAAVFIGPDSITMGNFILALPGL